MHNPTLFKRCKTDPPAEALWVNHANTLTTRQDFTTLRSLAGVQGDYWHIHQLLAEEQEEVARLKMGQRLFGVCANSLIKIDDLQKGWRRANPEQKEEAAHFTLTAVAISKLFRKTMPPPPSIEERMPEQFRSPQILTVTENSTMPS